MNRRHFISGLLASTAPLPSLPLLKGELGEYTSWIYKNWHSSPTFRNASLYIGRQRLTAGDLVAGQTVRFVWDIENENSSASHRRDRNT